VFVLGQPHPQPPSSTRRFSLRRVMRFMSLIAVIFFVIANPSDSNLSQIVPDYVTLPFAHIIELFATILLFSYLLQLARRSGLPSLRRHTLIAMIAVIFALCVWGFLDFFSDLDWADQIDTYARLLLIPIFLYQLYIFFLFRRTLRKSSAFARQYWHFCSPFPQSSGELP